MQNHDGWIRPLRRYAVPVCKGAAFLAGGLACVVICGLIVLGLYIFCELPSVDALKTTERLRSLRPNDKSFAKVTLLPAHNLPRHVVDAATAFLHSRDYLVLRRLSMVLQDGARYSHPKRYFLHLKIRLLLSREEILSAWLATEYYGKGAYGIGAAAETYYNKPLMELNICEAAMLIPVPSAPARANPLSDTDKARENRQKLLSDMLTLGLASEADVDGCINEP